MNIKIINKLEGAALLKTDPLLNSSTTLHKNIGHTIHSHKRSHLLSKSSPPLRLYGAPLYDL